MSDTLCACDHPREIHPSDGPCRRCGCLRFETGGQFAAREKALMDAIARTAAAKVKRERDHPEE